MSILYLSYSCIVKVDAYLVYKIIICSWNIHYNQEGFKTTPTVKREMLVSIIFSGFENITIWQRFNFFHLVTTGTNFW